jgi:hypothetical protein
VILEWRPVSEAWRSCPKSPANVHHFRCDSVFLNFPPPFVPYAKKKLEDLEFLMHLPRFWCNNAGP